MLLLNSLKLRTVKGPLSLVGPTIQSARTFQFSIDDTYITFRIPRYKSDLKGTQPRNPKKIYKLENTSLPRFNSSEAGWRSLILAQRAWDFYGPAFFGKQGFLTMSARIDSPEETSLNSSLFHPRAFEQTIADYLNICYGSHVFSFGQHWLVPSQWQPITNFESACVKFKAITRLDSSNYDLYLITALSDTKLFTIRFGLHWNHIENKTSMKPEYYHDISAMEKLCQEIITSLDVKLSDTALTQQKIALKELDDYFLTKEFLPLKFESKSEPIPPVSCY